ncbi:hypothetical protein [Blastococcus sp. TF02A-30]|uniref:hypothetical protein n=1 Tax=Blastococcus sp. TF02A-30 TaxID=2250580 RepID=UPI000DEB2B38|nr:hypothetical protein [Blastococcus sp. TF02A-30]RBY93090.1 hypothetical protein DQ241_03480 [Blastococcus sp. TF02A-30]
MSSPALQLPVPEVYGLARSLRSSAATAEDAGSRLGPGCEVDGPLAEAAAALLDCHRTLAGAVAGELRWLGTTVAVVADSWVELDATVVPAHGRAVAR